MGLYLKDNFPPLNPFFPELPYRGHYGRDLTIASLSILFGGKFLSVQYIITALNQAAIILLGYLTAKRYLGSYRQAMLGILFVFLGVKGSKTGLLEVFKNNNSFVYLLLFLNVYLYFRSMVRRDIASKIITILVFAVYGIVYETHYAILLIAVSLFPLFLSILRRRWRLRYFTITGFIVASSFLIALVQGGAITDLAKRYLLRSTDHSVVSEEIRGASQEVEVKFPRKGFRITSWRGDEFDVFSKQLLKEAGFFVLFLPLTVPLMVYVKNYWGIIFSMLSIFAILIPASVDFGRFNTESLRFLFFGGMSAAMLFGITLGMVGERLFQNTRIDKRLLLLVGVGILIFSLQKGLEKGVRVFAEAAKYPENFFFNPEEWACGPVAARYGVGRICDAIDVAAAKKIEPTMKRGDVILDNLYSHSIGATLNAKAVVSAFSGAYVTGMGIKFSKDRAFTMGVGYFKQVGFRAMTFWNTIDVDLLHELKTNYLYVDPDNIPPDLYKKLRGEGQLELIHRETDEISSQVREIYRVGNSSRAESLFVPADFRLSSVKMSETLTAEHFYQIPVVFSTRDPKFNGEVKMSYKIFYKGRRVDMNDEVKQTVRLKKQGKDGHMGSFYFVTPYDEGDYDLEFYVLDKGEYKSLLGENQEKVLSP